MRYGTLSALIAALAMNSSVPAQLQPLPHMHGEPCGADPIHRTLMLEDAQYRERTMHFEHAAAQFDGTFQRSLSTYKIPVVVHVMETGTEMSQITDDQVRGAIKAMNERFRKVAGTAGAGGGVDVGIEFALAVRDPSGNCTSGITRRNMTGNATYMASGVFRESAGISESQLKTLDVWDQDRYYNIWLVSEIDGNDGGSGIQGFAYFASSHGTALDGCVAVIRQVRDPASTVLTHELGHTMNVYHTFEGDGAGCPANASCSAEGDLVCDTPPHIRSNSDCNSGGTNTCAGGASNSNFVFNYMDYSSCGNMFTAGQAARMVLALTTDRASFLPANGNLSLVPPSFPAIDIQPSANLLCGAGQSVTLFNHSLCLPNTYLSDSEFPGITYAWTMTNGVNSYNSTLQNPTFTLASSGTYNATLTATSAQGSHTVTENGVVVVAAAPGAACIPTSGNPSANYGIAVSRVRFNTFDNLTSTGVNGVYQNFTCTKNTVVTRGGVYPLTITANGGSNGPAVYEVYIDYNNNGTFGDAGELVANGTSPAVGGVLSTNVTIPNTAVQNTLLRMRVYCDFDGISANERGCLTSLVVGDVEDYGVYVSASVPAVTIAASPGTSISYGTSVTFTPTPTNGGSVPQYHWFLNGVFLGVSPNYTASTLMPGDQVYCKLYSNLAGVQASPATSNTLTMTVTGAPLSDFTEASRTTCSGGSIAFSDASLLAPTSWSWSFPGGTPSTSSAQNPTITYNTPGTYAVTLIASNGQGTGSTRTRTGHITVYGIPLTACAVTRSTPPAGGIGITEVSVGTIAHSSPYNDAVMVQNTCTRIGVLESNTTYAINVSTSTANNQWLRVYIDYNRDGDFNDGGESIFSPANAMGSFSGTFTTPASPQYPGMLLRMRVITDFVNTVPGACTDLQYGQVEEYGIVVNAPANMAPVLNAAASPLLSAVLEDGAAPVGAVGTLVSALVDPATPSGGLDNVTDPDAGALTGIAITAADAANGTWSYTINGGANWSALGTPSGTVSRLLAADANTRLYFQPNANYNGVVASAITFRAWDRTSGTNGATADASVNGGSTAFSTVTDVASITVTAVNDAPVLNPAASPVLTAVLEDAAIPVGAQGTLVSALVDLTPPSGQLDNVTDADVSPATGLAITAVDATSGTFYYSINGGTNWSLIGTPSPVFSRLLAADANTRLYFRPAADFNGTIASAITFRAWDQTSGTNGATANTSTNGGTTAFSTATDMASIAVDPVNDAPIITVPGTQTTDQEQALFFGTGTANAISVSDVDAGSASVQLTMSITNGTLWLPQTAGLSFTTGDGSDDVTMVFTGTLSAVNAALNGLVYAPAAGYAGSAVLSVTVNDQGNTGSGGALSDVEQVLINVLSTDVVLQLRMVLDGPYDPLTGLMRDALRTLPSFPSMQPYGVAPWSYGGTESVTPAILAAAGNDAVVDWVLVQLRSAGDMELVVAQTAALLQSDGDVVGSDDGLPLTLPVAAGSYHVAVLHRNHLGIMTGGPQPLSATVSVVDLSLSTTVAFGTEPRKSVNGVQVLWSGDVNGDGELRYTGDANDRDPMLLAIGGAIPTDTVSGYRAEDVNLDGAVMYTGLGNDRDIVLQNIGGVVPTTVRFEQLP